MLHTEDSMPKSDTTQKAPGAAGTHDSRVIRDARPE